MKSIKNLDALSSSLLTKAKKVSNSPTDSEESEGSLDTKLTSNMLWAMKMPEGMTLIQMKTLFELDVCHFFVMQPLTSFFFNSL